MDSKLIPAWLVAILVVAAAVLCAQEPPRNSVGSPGVAAPPYSIGPTDVILFEDFVCGTTTDSGSHGCLGWLFGGAGSISYSVSPGTVGTINVTAGVSQSPYLRLAPTASSFPIKVSNFRRFIGKASWFSPGSQPDASLGITPSNPPPSGDAAFFEHWTGEANWQVVIQNSGGSNRYDTQVSYTGSTFALFEVAHPSTGLWNFYINGQLVKSLDTGRIPSETGDIAPWFYMRSKASSTMMRIDWALLELTTPRKWVRH